MPTIAPCAPPTRPRPPASPSPTRIRLSTSTKFARRGERTLTDGPLASYLDDHGRRRELLTLPGYGGSVLVLDRDAITLRDRRLVAHLAVDEPMENAALVCELYLTDVRGRWCRRVQPTDLLIDPLDAYVSTVGLDRPVA